MVSTHPSVQTPSWNVKAWQEVSTESTKLQVPLKASAKQLLAQSTGVPSPARRFVEDWRWNCFNHIHPPPFSVAYLYHHKDAGEGGGLLRWNYSVLGSLSVMTISQMWNPRRWTYFPTSWFYFSSAYPGTAFSMGQPEPGNGKLELNLWNPGALSNASIMWKPKGCFLAEDNNFCERHFPWCIQGLTWTLIFCNAIIVALVSTALVSEWVSWW